MTNSLKITTVQTDLVWENIPRNLALFESKINGLKEKQDIIILPEMFTTGFSMNPKKLAEKPNGKTFQWMTKMAKATNAVITGSYILESNEHYFNHLLWMQPDGNHFTYNKRHLFSLSEEPQHYRAGKEKLIINFKGWKICPLICYDLRFPIWSRNVEGYDLLIYVANWPEQRSHHWRSLLIARAIENQVYTIGVNRVGKDGNGIYHSGDTTVLDYSGSLLQHDAHVESISTIELNLQNQQSFRSKFPFLADQDAFKLI